MERRLSKSSYIWLYDIFVTTGIKKDEKGEIKVAKNKKGEKIGVFVGLALNPSKKEEKKYKTSFFSYFISYENARRILKEKRIKISEKGQAGWILISIGERGISLIDFEPVKKGSKHPETLAREKREKERKQKEKNIKTVKKEAVDEIEIDMTDDDLSF